MQIKTIEHSPFPRLKSVKSTRLILNKAEWNALVKAQKIIAKVTDLVFNHLKTPAMGDTFSLGDIDFDLEDTITHLEYLIESHGNEGLKID